MWRLASAYAMAAPLARTARVAPLARWLLLAPRAPILPSNVASMSTSSVSVGSRVRPGRVATKNSSAHADGARSRASTKQQSPSPSRARAPRSGAKAAVEAPKPTRKPKPPPPVESMSTIVPVVAIIGRPNVGKSTLFNQLTRDGTRMRGTNRRRGTKVVQSLVTPTPGTTRDRVYGMTYFPLKTCTIPVLLVDTGGIAASVQEETQSVASKGDTHVASGAPLSSRIQKQTELAVREADAVLFLTDVVAGVTDKDREIVAWLRKLDRSRSSANQAEKRDMFGTLVEIAKPHSKPLLERTVLVVNKVDNEKRAEHVAEFRRLGFPTQVPISAAHNDGCFHTLAMAIQQCGLFKDGVVPVNDDVESEADSLDEDDDANAADDDDNDDDDDAIKSDAELVHQVEAELREPVDQLSADPTQAPRIAIVGRPNVGKSSLLNAVAGEGRSVVSPIAGTTSDPVDQYVLWRGKHPMTLVDTAGIRRRSKHKQGLESISVLWSLKAIELSEVTILMIDAQQGILAQDKRVANFILERHRGVVVVVNKWDGPVALQNSQAKYEEFVRTSLGFMNYVPIIFTSAVNNTNIAKVMDVALDVVRERRQRIPSKQLMNIMSENIIQKPPSSGRRHLKLKFATQANLMTPTFLVFVNHIDLATSSYVRFLESSIRQHYPFIGTPIRILVRASKRKEKRITPKPKSK